MAKGKSARKPLVDVSNAKMIQSAHKKGSHERDDALNRLSLAHADLSDLFNQIDKLVAQTLSSQCKMGIQEIESFAHMLSEEYSSLKPRVLKFEQGFVRPLSASGTRLGASLAKDVTPEINKEKSIVNSPEKPDPGSSIVSPSPLVSWHPNCRVENGTELFLLTPLPKSKLMSSKRSSSCKPSKQLSEKKSSEFYDLCHTHSLPASIATFGCSSQDILEGTEVDETPKTYLQVRAANSNLTEGTGLCSPSKFTEKDLDHSFLIMTPFRRMSPFKTCMLLEPTSESMQQDRYVLPVPEQSTATIWNGNSHSSVDCLSENVSTFHELLEIVPTTIRRNKTHASLNWFLSPPKTCVLMNPSDEEGMTDEPSVAKCSPKFVPARQPTDEASTSAKGVQYSESINTDLPGMNFAAVEATPSWKGLRTPMWNNLQSASQVGKRPGENTLKRELWTKFDAVSAKGLHYNVSVFLDRLEEASWEETDLA